MDYQDVAAALERRGLRARGGFYPGPRDAVPAMPGGGSAATLILAGSVGGSLWPTFSGSPEWHDGLPDPLDRWSRRVLSAVAGDLGACALFPAGGPPYYPFQRWAQRAEPVSPSPLGLLIHPRHGLWHAYRGALLFADRLDLPPPETVASPCEDCRERPCLSACPVGAFGAGGYDVGACVTRLEAEPESCMETACLARAACPVAPGLAYAPAQARFHLGAFLSARQTAGSGLA